MRKFEIFKNADESDLRLKELGLRKALLVKVAEAAHLARLNTTPNHAVNAAGTYSYHEGIRTLRDLLVGADWRASRKDNVEYIENKKLNVRVGFCNVTYAASTVHDPDPVSPRKSATSAACYANNQQYGLDFGSINNLTDVPKTYYLMVGTDGTAELSLPLECESGKFSELVERIFVVTADDLDSDDFVEDIDADEPEIDIDVSRKM